MGCCSQITDMLKSILSALGPIIAIALVCFAVYFIFLAGPGVLTALAEFTWLPASLTGLTLEAATWGYLALGAAVIISPETVTAIAGTAAKVVGKVAGAVVAGVAGGLVAGATGMSFTSLALWGIGGYLLFTLLTKDKKEPAVTAVSESKRSPDEVDSAPPFSSATIIEQPFAQEQEFNYGF